ncbi:polyprotein [Tomato ringspot virus]|uniref:RNA2 polyprotein n=4 Tax=Tomato ringspot virus TaxID=12280 RepID=POL2_TORVR|nr:polyprotein [Tomato ringspot virus]P25247.1 RecName: Full=RNA2 polyprotein; AltName: Full=P2; Contains: RecName: Full=Protein X3; Contains: RecName: Full=Protein X4; Contains: RecName: Full=Movement protein; Short=MP; Contains: RecName: Full=Coat protein; Short=CP [Tomato ringspot virus (isolate raspberry)]BAA02043.1 polyprotein [Tomato ringspot virus]
MSSICFAGGNHARLPSKAAYYRAISDRELDREGRFPCGCLAQYTVQAPPPAKTQEKAVGRSADLQKGNVAPLKKQRCDVVVAVSGPPPLELVYPARVGQHRLDQPSKGPLAVPSAKQTSTAMEVVLSAEEAAITAPWLLRPCKGEAPPPPPLTQRQQFAALKKRLAVKGQQIIREHIRARKAAKYAAIAKAKKAAALAAVKAAQEAPRLAAQKAAISKILRDRDVAALPPPPPPSAARLAAEAELASKAESLRRLKAFKTFSRVRPALNTSFPPPPPPPPARSSELLAAFEAAMNRSQPVQGGFSLPTRKGVYVAPTVQGVVRAGLRAQKGFLNAVSTGIVAGARILKSKSQNWFRRSMGIAHDYVEGCMASTVLGCAGPVVQRQEACSVVAAPPIVEPVLWVPPLSEYANDFPKLTCSTFTEWQRPRKQSIAISNLFRKLIDRALLVSGVSLIASVLLFEIAENFAVRQAVCPVEMPSCATSVSEKSLVSLDEGNFYLRKYLSPPPYPFGRESFYFQARPRFIGPMPSMVRAVPQIVQQPTMTEELEFEVPSSWSSPLPLFANFKVNRGACFLQVLPQRVVLPDECMDLLSLFEDQLPEGPLPSFSWSSPLPLFANFKVNRGACFLQVLPQRVVLPDECMDLLSLFEDQLPEGPLPSFSWSSPLPLFASFKVNRGACFLQVLPARKVVSDEFMDVLPFLFSPLVSHQEEEPEMVPAVLEAADSVGDITEAFFDDLECESFYDSYSDEEEAEWAEVPRCKTMSELCASLTLAGDAEGLRKSHGVFLKRLVTYLQSFEEPLYSSRAFYSVKVKPVYRPKKFEGHIDCTCLDGNMGEWEWRESVDAMWRCPGRLLNTKRTFTRDDWERVQYLRIGFNEGRYRRNWRVLNLEEMDLSLHEYPEISSAPVQSSLFSRVVDRGATLASSIPFVTRSNCQSSLGTPGLNVHTIHQEAPTTLRAPPFTGARNVMGSSDAGANAAPYRSEARKRWLSRKQEDSQEDNIKRYADKHGISFEEARAVYKAPKEGVPTQRSILPDVRDAYSARSAGARVRSLFGGSPTTRAQRTEDFVLTSPSAGDASSFSFYFNPVSEQEMAEQERGGNTMLSLDAVEVVIDPVGMPGDDTDLTVMVLWCQNSDDQRALIGAMSTFVGNGLARAVFYPGLKLLYANCRVRDGRVLKVIVSSTNSTLTHGLPQAQVSIGTLRQHLGPGHDRTISGALYASQQQGFNIRATEQGGAVTFAPQGGHVEGIPSANVQMGAGEHLIQAGPMQWRLQRSQSSRFVVSGHSRTRGSSLFTGSVDRTQQGTGAFEDPGFLPPRNSSVQGGSWQEGTEAAYLGKVTCAKDAKGGTLLHTLDIIKECKSQNLLRYKEWQRQGFLHGKLRLRCFIPTNIFCGHSMMCSLDAFGRYDSNVLGASFPVKLASLLPTEVISLADGPVVTWTFDIGRLCGHGLYYSEGAYARPKIYFLVLSDNDVPAEADWQFTYQLLFEDHTFSNSFGAVPFITLPHIFNRLDIGYWRGPTEIDLTSTPAPNAYRLLFGLSTVISGNMSTLNANQALLRFFQGSNGTLHGRIKKIGTALTTCSLLLSLRHKDASLTLETAYQRPHYILADGQGAFSLPISTPHAATSFLEDMLRLEIFAIAGPFSPKDNKAKYQFMCYFDHIELVEGVPRTIAGEQQFNWCSFRNFKIDDWKFEWPARLPDILDDKSEVLLRQHPLSLLISSTGFFTGRAIFVFQWGLNTTAGNMKGSFSARLAFGKGVEEIEQTSTVQPLVGACEARIPVEFKTYTGYTTSGPPGSMEPYIYVRLTQAKLVDRLSVNVILQEGFSFYGPSVKHFKKEVGTPSATLGTNNPVGRPPENVDTGGPGGQYAAALQAAQQAGKNPFGRG